MTVIIASLNGERDIAEHPQLPNRGDALAEEARAAVRSGANLIHAHSRSPDGAQLLTPVAVEETLSVLRQAVPGVPISLSTSARAEPDPDLLIALVQSWTALPEFATVDVWQDGWFGLMKVLLEAGVSVEVGVSNVEEAQLFVESDLVAKCARLMLEPMSPDPTAAFAHALAAREVVESAGYRGPVLLHGWNDTAWPMLRAAIELCCDVRIGLEDTLVLPDGRTASGNAELVAVAVEWLQRDRARA